MGSLLPVILAWRPRLVTVGIPIHSSARGRWAILALRNPASREADELVSHVECTICGHRHDAKRLLTVCAKCGQMLAVRYDLERVKAHVTKDTLTCRPPGMYRLRELTPLNDGEEPVTLGEGGTPLRALPRLAAHLGTSCGAPRPWRWRVLRRRRTPDVSRRIRFSIAWSGNTSASFSHKSRRVIKRADSRRS